MKEFLLIALISLSTLTYAQKFSVTPNGLRDAANLENSFVVIPADGKTAKQLYDDAFKYINKTYKSADDVIKGNVDGEYLKFITYAPNCMIFKAAMGGVWPLNTEYTIELNFKDGKVKYEIIELKIYSDAVYLVFSGGGLSNYIYNKKGELKSVDTKVSVEKYFNAILLSLANSLQGKATDDKW